MDAVLFKGSQRLESIQVQAEMVSSKMKDLIHAYSQQTKVLLLQTLDSPRLDHMRENVRELITYLIAIGREFRTKALDMADPKRLYMFLSTMLCGKWSKRELSIACAGFVVGGLVGVAVGLAIRKKEPAIRYMEAVQISHYLGIEAASVVEDAIAPYECGDYDVLINVKAASVQIVDAQICSGYGRNFRRILRKLYKQSESDLPLILGRDCTGIITDLGKKVTRLEIGDEVWVTVPFWSQGTLSQTVMVSANRVARKPKNVGFEGACSIPYAGSLALSVLTEAKIDPLNAQCKRFFIQGACTPVGCVLVQLLHHWKAEVIASCYKRALPVAKALGADDIISVEDPEKHQSDENSTEIQNDEQSEWKALLKELEVRGSQYDAIFVTRNDNYDWHDLKTFLTNEGRILSTVAPDLLSDSCGVVTRTILVVFVRMRHLLQKLLGSTSNDYDECHLCHVTLDKLAEYVEDGQLQTVVDKVFQPRDIEIALHHIQSPRSIGSTISRDREFWDRCVEKLMSFFVCHLLPELGDPLHPKGLDIRKNCGNINELLAFL